MEEGDTGKKKETRSEGAFDPHFWFILRWKKQYASSPRKLIEIRKGLSATEWNERATNYIAQSKCGCRGRGVAVSGSRGPPEVGD